MSTGATRRRHRSRTLLSVTPQTGPTRRHLAGARDRLPELARHPNPEGGGAERALEEVAEGLVDAGRRVTVFSAAYAGAPPEEVVDGVRYVRRGSKLSVYLRGMQALAPGRLGRPTWSSTCRTACRSSPAW